MTSDLINRISDIGARYTSEVLGARNSALAENERFSEDKLKAIRKRVSQHPPPTNLQVRMLAVAGSLARLDASAESDLDLIVTFEHERGADYPRDDYIRWRNQLCAALIIEPCNPLGVFADPISHAQICGSAGESDENYADVAKRILILLESTWLSSEDDFRETVATILERYAADVTKDQRKTSSSY